MMTSKNPQYSFRFPDEESRKKLHQDAIEFRRKKVKEIIEKGKDATEMEIHFLKMWSEHYGEEAW